MDEVIYTLTLISALGCGIAGGVFFAFSTSIMTALGRVPAAHGIAAMQSINIAVINPLFLGAIFVPALTCIALAILSAIDWNEPEVFYHLAGSGLYVLGAIIVTIAFNIPRNDALAAVHPDSAAGADLWRRYLIEWTAWNHVRTAAPIVAAALLTIALSVD